MQHRVHFPLLKGPWDAVQDVPSPDAIQIASNCMARVDGSQVCNEG